MDDDQKPADDTSEVVEETETVETPETEESPAQDQKPEVDVAKLQNDFNSLKGKMSKLEKERNEYATVATAWKALNEAAAEDPKFALEANKRLLEKGVISQEQFEELEAKFSDKKGKPEPVSADPALEWARKKAQEERLAEETFIEQFETAHPDIAEAGDEIAALNRAEIGASAKRLMALGKPKSEAFELAYKKWAGKSEEEAELQGMAKARAATPAIGAASGSSATTQSGQSLSDEEIDAANRLGMTPEEYTAAKDPNYGSDLNV